VKTEEPARAPLPVAVKVARAPTAQDTPAESLTVGQLRTELVRLGKSGAGPRAELVARLDEHRARLKAGNVTHVPAGFDLRLDFFMQELLRTKSLEDVTKREVRRMLEAKHGFAAGALDALKAEIDAALVAMLTTTTNKVVETWHCPRCHAVHHSVRPHVANGWHANGCPSCTPAHLQIKAPPPITMRAPTVALLKPVRRVGPLSA
jgi:hypothetical protein